jgi:HSP20 family protein
MVGTHVFGEPLMLRDAMQRLFDESFVPFGWKGNGSGTSAVRPLAVDLYSTQDHYTLRAFLPGVSPEDVDVIYADGAVTIKAKVAQPAAPEGEQVSWFFHELGDGIFARTIQFADPIEPDRVETSFVNGVLTLTLPKAEWAKPKKIAIASQTPELVGAGETH